MTKDLISKLENWKFQRELALDILKSLSDKQLNLTVGKHMGTLGEQFRHMARVQIQYTEAIKNKKISPTQKKIDLGVAKSKEKLLELWEQVNSEMLGVLGALSNQEVKDLIIDWEYWGIDSMNLPSHLDALLDHGNLHNGQIIVYLRTYEIPFPKSWEAWGL